MISLNSDDNLFFHKHGVGSVDTQFQNTGEYW